MKLLTEDTRKTLVAKSQNAGPYKNQSKGKNRFARKKYSRIANQVKSYNQINMDNFFKKDILEVGVPITGETSNYTVTIKFSGVIKELQNQLKTNQYKLEYKIILQSLIKVFNTTNIYVKCTCADFKYRFDYWSIVNNYSVNDSAQNPGPGKGITNPNNTLGIGCKHILLVLANGDWLMKVASVINIHNEKEMITPPFVQIAPLKTCFSGENVITQKPELKKEI